jgi:hypothetical protein
MTAPQEAAAAEPHDATLLALLDAADCRLSRREGRTLSFHEASWHTHAGADLAGLLEAPPHRPHIRVEDIAALLSGTDGQDWLA